MNIHIKTLKNNEKHFPHAIIKDQYTQGRQCNHILDQIYDRGHSSKKQLSNYFTMTVTSKVSNRPNRNTLFGVIQPKYIELRVNNAGNNRLIIV